ncbi:MAG: methyltransferase domain-containing protein [Oligoflexia bacterium]|nr:methyltransferase domain-containing protein [Oligoflexia bacterium]
METIIKKIFNNKYFFQMVNLVGGLGLKYKRFNLSEYTPENNPALLSFWDFCKTFKSPSVIELGTKRQNPTIPTHHKEWVPHALEFLGTDIENGIDVDIVADLHSFAEVVGNERFDIIISCSTLEHIKYPHLAAHHIMKSLKVGGGIFIQTHQTYPYHGYPHDYFRYSVEALSGMFNEKMGMKIISSCYRFPARICNPRESSVSGFSAYLNVCFFAKKIAPTPDSYLYDL